MNLAQAAVAYAKSGFRVLPLHPGGKDPLPALAPRGYMSASADHETVALWWRERPDANVGVVPASAGYVVIDVDVKGAADGSEQLDTLELLYGELPATARAATPSGGFHLWFRLPEGAEAPGNGKLDSALDIRSGAGYVVAAPSTTPRGSYTWERLDPPPTMPAAWFQACQKPARREAPAAETEVDPLDLDTPRDIERAEAYALNAEPAVEGNDGSKQTYKIAAAIRELGVSEDECLRIMAENYNPRCMPPWDVSPAARGPDALASRVASAYRNARNAAGAKSNKSLISAFDDIPAAPAAPADDIPADDIPADEAEAAEVGRTTPPATILSDGDIDDLEPPEWDIEDLLPRQSLVALYGEPGTYKSFLALDWAYHLAHGMDWAGYEVDEPRRVLYVAGEGKHGLMKRLRA